MGPMTSLTSGGVGMVFCGDVRSLARLVSQMAFVEGGFEDLSGCVLVSPAGELVRLAPRAGWALRSMRCVEGPG
jgi:hypothetical protein